MMRAVVPGLLSVTDWLTLLVFTVWLSNVRTVFDKRTCDAAGSDPIPVSGIV
jgi:hypothetical protein